MAQVATVSSIAPFPRSVADILHTLRDAAEVDAKRPRPTDERAWASVEKEARSVIREAFDEALRHDPEKRRRWVVLVDGERKQLRAVKKGEPHPIRKPKKRGRCEEAGLDPHGNVRAYEARHTAMRAARTAPVA